VGLPRLTDALGAAVEFNWLGSFPEVTGYRGGGTPPQGTVLLVRSSTILASKIHLT
jgi:hypothetical protein